MSELKKYGRLRAVPGSDSGLELQACDDCNKKQVCKDIVEVAVTPGTLIRGILIDGEEKLFDQPYAVEDLKSPIDAAVGHFEVSPKFVCYEYDGTNATITHKGMTTVGTLVDASGTQLTATAVRYCTIGKECTSVLTLPFTQANTPDLVVTDENGNETVNASLAGDYTAGDAAAVTALQTDLGAAIPDSTVVVTADAAGSFYSIEFKMSGDNTVMLGDKKSSVCECTYDYVSA